MATLKASCPDGFQATFFQTVWDVVGEDVSSSVIRFLEGAEKLPSGMADTLLVLIPKTDKLESIKQFCPITLCNVMFKMVTKVIVNRLKELTEDLVSPNQCSFIRHRQIGDNIIIC